jgi:iron complex transport system ATP-binding protein
MIDLHEVVKQLGHDRFGPYSMSVNSGDRMAIVGPNGAGKSSLLQLLSGTSKTISGQITFNHRPVKHWSLKDLSQFRAVLPQTHDIAFALPVEVVIGLGRVAKSADAVGHQIVMRAAALVGVSHLLKRTIDTLSGGELARVQFARIFAQLWDAEDGLILMDEPIAAVDPGLQGILLETLMLFARIRRHAVVAVMHDITLALRYFKCLVLVQPGHALKIIESSRYAKEALESLFSVRLSYLVDEQGDCVMTPLRPSLAETAVAFSSSAP